MPTPLNDATRAEVLKLHHQGFSMLQIAERTGCGKSTVHRIVSTVPSEAFGTPSSQASSQATSQPPDIVVLGLKRSLVGLHLSPRELLDAKDAGTLPANAWLDAFGKVEIRQVGAEPLWPSYAALGLVQGLKNRYGLASPEEPRRANRQREGSK